MQWKIKMYCFILLATFLEDFKSKLNFYVIYYLIINTTFPFETSTTGHWNGEKQLQVAVNPRAKVHTEIETRGRNLWHNLRRKMEMTINSIRFSVLI